ncbi:MAG: hypothetical protein ACOC44_18425 [Promethearchaeia archaeon]
MPNVKGWIESYPGVFKRIGDPMHRLIIKEYKAVDAKKPKKVKVKVTGKDTRDFDFDTKKEAYKYAKKYMKRYSGKQKDSSTSSQISSSDLTEPSGSLF